jgi:predicted esterase
MPEVIAVPATVHGRVLIEARGAGSQGAPLLVGFHGYAENAERHFEELAAIPGIEGWVLASVQGLHPFYNKTGDVVANWMTKQDRELAIADNAAYVRAAVERVRAHTGAGGPLVYLGFSQGVAMAYRAAALAGHAVAGVVALGGDLPPELAESGFGAAVTAGTQLRVLVSRGAGDPWYTTEKMTADLAALARQGVAVESAVYPGGHEWTADFRALAGRFLSEIAESVATQASDP